MELLLYWVAQGVLGLIRILPLMWVARLGRLLGGLVYFCDARHRKRAALNLQLCFAEEKSPAEIKAIARENFRRIGEGFCCAAKTATMTFEQVQTRCDLSGIGQIPSSQPGRPLQSRVLAIGHFANFELWARLGQLKPDYQCAATYRGLRQASLNRLLQRLRTKSGCLFFERRSEGAALKAAMRRPGTLLGLLADQHAGDHGLRLPFLGRDCSTSAAPAIFALRYGCPLHVGLIFRTAPARWRVELSQPIPTTENGHPRSTADIMADVNKVFEAAVRRDPANWFWVHNRWKLKDRPARPPAAPASTSAFNGGAPAASSQ